MGGEDGTGEWLVASEYGHCVHPVASPPEAGYVRWLDASGRWPLAQGISINEWGRQ